MALPAFEPDYASPSDWAAMYRDCGLQVVPGRLPREGENWKRPALDWKSFEEALVPEATFGRWYGQGGEFFNRRNMGVLTGRCSGNLLVVDLDTYKNDQATAWWSNLLSEHTYGIEPETCEQTTGGGGRQLFFKAPAGWRAPTNRTGINVDVRGQGGFAVLPPSAHVSGRAYAWREGRGPWECEIAEAPDWLLSAVEGLVAEHGGGERAGGERTATPPSDLDAFGNVVDGREAYMARLVWASVLDWWRECPIEPTEAESRARMREAYAVYERKVKSRLSAADPQAALLEREGRGATLFAEKWRRAVAQWGGEVAAQASLPRAAAEGLGPAPGGEAPRPPEGAAGGIPLLRAFPIDPRAIPVRDWVVPGLLLRRYLSVLVAPPGSGKSLLTLQLAIAMGVGREWAGWRVREPTRTLVINAEDDLTEMQRRLWSAAELMRVRHEDVADAVFLAQAPESIVIARVDGKTKTVVRTPLVDQLVAAVEGAGISTVIVDPFAETFEGDENSNSEVKWAGILWREVARRTGCAVFLVHHTKKYAGDMAGNADASRGGGALVGTARIVSTLFAMTEEEAKVMGVPPERRAYHVRFDDAKANMSLVTGVARWFEKHTVTVPNATISAPGDEVGVLMPWRPPGAFEGISMATIGTALDALDRGLTDDRGHPTGAFYTHADNSADKSRWAGAVLARLFGCGDDKAKLILKEWLKNGVLEVFDFDDPRSRNPKKGVRSVPEKRPDRGAR